MKRKCRACAKLWKQVEALEKERDAIRAEHETTLQQFWELYQFADDMLGGGLSVLVKVVSEKHPAWLRRQEGESS